MQTYKDVVATFKEKNPKKDGTWKYDPELGFYRQGRRVGYKPGGIVEPGVTHYATEYLSNEEFSSLYKKFKGTDKEFADSLNKKGYKAKADRKFTADSVFTRRKRLELESKGYVRPTIKDFKKEAKALGIDIKGLDDQTIKNKVRDKRGDLVKQKKRLTDPDFAAKERAIQKAWQEANPEKVKEVRFQSRVRAYEKTGMIQPVKNAKEELWRSLFEDGKRYTEGRRLKIQGDYGRYVPREEFLNAKILDTKTGKTITFKNLENYINLKNTGKTYDQVIKPYNQKWFINDTPGLRTEINSKLIPNWTKADKRNFFEIQHNAGRYNDPFDVSLSNRSVNLKESQVRTKFEKMWNASDNLSDKKKAFKFYNDNLPKEILSKPSIVERPRYFGTEVPFEKQLQFLKGKGVNIPSKGMLGESFSKFAKKMPTTAGAIGGTGKFLFGPVEMGLLPLALVAEGLYQNYKDKKDLKRALDQIDMPQEQKDAILEGFRQEARDIGGVGLETYAINQPNVKDQLAEQYKGTEGKIKLTQDARAGINIVREQDAEAKKLKKQEIEKRTKEAYENAIGRGSKRPIQFNKGGLAGYDDYLPDMEGIE